MSDLFHPAEIVSERPQPRCQEPFCIVAYWPAGGYWKLFPRLYETPDGGEIKADCSHITSRGWTYIKIVKLPI